MSFWGGFGNIFKFMNMAQLFSEHASKFSECRLHLFVIILALAQGYRLPSGVSQSLKNVARPNHQIELCNSVVY